MFLIVESCKTISYSENQRFLSSQIDQGSLRQLSIGDSMIFENVICKEKKAAFQVGDILAVKRSDKIDFYEIGKWYQYFDLEKDTISVVEYDLELGYKSISQKYHGLKSLEIKRYKSCSGDIYEIKDDGQSESQCHKIIREHGTYVNNDKYEIIDCQLARKIVEEICE
jgi:hypothetical protein